jgi:hypothetical protein
VAFSRRHTHTHTYCTHEDNNGITDLATRIRIINYIYIDLYIAGCNGVDAIYIPTQKDYMVIARN